MTTEKLELTEREARELAFALDYAGSYHHGTDGHSRLMLLAKLAKHMGIKKPIGSVIAQGDCIIVSAT